MQYLDLPQLKEMALLDSQATVSLSPQSRALVYAAHHLIKDHARWTGASSEGLTDEETDEIDAIVEKLILEVLSPMIGQIFLFATDTLPENLLPMDGTSHLETDYPALYAVLCEEWKYSEPVEGEDDILWFYLPSMAFTYPVGAGESESGSMGVGDSFGSNTKQLTEAQLPPHDHQVTLLKYGGDNIILNGELLPATVPIVFYQVELTDPAGEGEYFDVTPQSIAFLYGIVYQ